MLRKVVLTVFSNISVELGVEYSLSFHSFPFYNTTSLDKPKVSESSNQVLLQALLPFLFI
jgi:hypothetical protein